MERKRIGVIGSANMDLVVRTDHMPAANENVFGRDFRTIPGGKGANQAVAVARLGAQAVFVGKVGRDAFGTALLESLRAEGVDTTCARMESATPSGTALIVVDAQGRNSIIICPGANGHLLPADIDALSATLRALDVLVMQLEIPPETAAHAIRRAAQWGVPVILDAGPPCREPLPEFFQVAVLTPNEAEAGALLGRPIRNMDEAERAAAELLERGAKAVVLKLGDKGALLLDRENRLRVPAHRVKVVDSTAAGDAFTGALAVYMAEGMPLPKAVEMANRAGALACTRLGAQPSMPLREEVEAFTGA